jgi:anaerobic selenocysteine-containing dehydrogenase
VLDRFGLIEGALIRIGNDRGEVVLPTRAVAGMDPATVVVESTWPGQAFAGGLGINQLIGDEPAAPNGGAAFHDTAVWLRPAEQQADGTQA